MLDKSKLQRVKGILSAKKGTQVPKFGGGKSFSTLTSVLDDDESFEYYRSLGGNQYDEDAWEMLDEGTKQMELIRLQEIPQNLMYAGEFKSDYEIHNSQPEEGTKVKIPVADPKIDSTPNQSKPEESSLAETDPKLIKARQDFMSSAVQGTMSAGNFSQPVYYKNGKIYTGIGEVKDGVYTPEEYKAGNYSELGTPTITWSDPKGIIATDGVLQEPKVNEGITMNGTASYNRNTMPVYIKNGKIWADQNGTTPYEQEFQQQYSDATGDASKTKPVVFYGDNKSLNDLRVLTYNTKTKLDEEGNTILDYNGNPVIDQKTAYSSTKTPEKFYSDVNLTKEIDIGDAFKDANYANWAGEALDNPYQTKLKELQANAAQQQANFERLSGKAEKHSNNLRLQSRAASAELASYQADLERKTFEGEEITEDDQKRLAELQKANDDAAQTLKDRNAATKQVGSYLGQAIDLADKAFRANKDYASDDWSTSGVGRQTYDAVSSSLMGFSPIGTIVGGAMKAFGFVNDVVGEMTGPTDDFAADEDAISQVGSTYGGTVDDINSAVAKSGKSYGLLGLRKKKKANEAIAEARRKQSALSDIAKDSYDRQSASTLMSDFNNLSYSYQMNGGYDQRYMRAAKSGTKIEYFHEPFAVKLSTPNVFEVNLSEPPAMLKTGGTILDTLDKKFSFKVVLTDVEAPQSLKSGGIIKDREIEVIETNTTQKSVIPEGALHKNKHHLDQVGVDDSELTKKGIPVVDVDGDQQAEIELNEIIFTLEVTKEIESRYREFYEEGTSKAKQDELAIEAGKLLWKEILYNTDDRTGLIDTLKKGGTLQKDPRKPAYKDWVSDVNPAFINDNYDLETAYKYLPYEQLQRWKMAVNSENPDYYLNYQDPKTGEYIYHLGSIAPYGKEDYIFLKKGREKDNPELHWETDTYHDGSNGLKETHDLVYDEKEGRYFYRKKKSVTKHQLGGNITQDDINQMVKQALINILLK